MLICGKLSSVFLLDDSGWANGNTMKQTAPGSSLILVCIHSYVCMNAICLSTADAPNFFENYKCQLLKTFT